MNNYISRTPLKTRSSPDACLAHELLSFGKRDTSEHFRICKAKSERSGRTVKSKVLRSNIGTQRLIKLGLIELRKLFGYTSSGKRDSLRQLVEMLRQ